MAAIWLHYVRCVVGLVMLFVPLFIFIGLPQLGLLTRNAKRGNESADEMHVRMCRWFFRWCQVYNRCLWLTAGLRWEFVISDEDRELARQIPMLVTGNHYGLIDATLLGEGGMRVGVERVRGVAMQETSSWPVIGTVLKLGKTAFMRRKHVSSGPNQDVEDLLAFGKSLHEDQSWAVIFVEGRTFEGVPDEGYRNVRKPKTRGLEAMLSGAPKHPLMVVSYVWHDYDPRKMLWTGAVPPGSKVTMHIKVIREPDVATVREWLPLEWHRIDDQIQSER
ncbi:MAG: 1-acyl-sn-glycerol-3-phosphate acyltransferase [Candidatus Uhrbacteria bacterium]|nr:1-acyl-sn-glycerol-3-phosphate acyltransferase [Candidatus Uhrbacteria bacterium]